MTPDDDAVLRMLAGANFGPNANVVLPSGERLNGDEAQALTSFYADEPIQPIAPPAEAAPRVVRAKRLWMTDCRAVALGACGVNYGAVTWGWLAGGLPITTGGWVFFIFSHLIAAATTAGTVWVWRSGL